ncbi:hypothetical protein [Streptomyces sp. NPDC051098]|uniref:hypothetical protein n=1 Tax=Streptomyces sp. NPDC051098 TaxID=3155411 RepID=UPI003412B28B
MVMMRRVRSLLVVAMTAVAVSVTAVPASGAGAYVDQRVNRCAGGPRCGVGVVVEY